MGIWIGLGSKCRHFGTLIVGKSFESLIGFEMPFDPKTLALLVPEAECVGRKTVDVTVRIGQASIGVPVFVVNGL